MFFILLLPYAANRVLQFIAFEYIYITEANMALVLTHVLSLFDFYYFLVSCRFSINHSKTL